MSCLVAQSPYLRVVSTLPSPHACRKFLCSLLPFTLPPLLSPWEGPPCFLCGSLLLLLSLPWSQSVGNLMYDQAMFLFKNKKTIQLLCIHSKTKVLAAAIKDCPLPSSPAIFLKYDLIGLSSILSHSHRGCVFAHTPRSLCNFTSCFRTQVRWHFLHVAFRWSWVPPSMLPQHPALALSLCKYCLILELF